MRWVFLGLILLCLPSVFAVDPDIIIDPSSGPLNTVVTVSASITPSTDGNLYIYLASGLDADSVSCSQGVECTLDHTATISSENYGFYAEFVNDTAALTSSTEYFDIVDNVPPSLNYFFVPVKPWGQVLFLVKPWGQVLFLVKPWGQVLFLASPPAIETLGSLKPWGQVLFLASPARYRFALSRFTQPC